MAKARGILTDISMKPIYEPKGKAKEYGDLAINIYTGCPHKCQYCFAPGVLRRDKDAFHSDIRPRPNVVDEVRNQIHREHITDKLIHLCFTCDPYPTGYDSTPTREIIKVLKETGNHVQILTKGDGSRDFDLLDSNDWYGISLSCDDLQSVRAEPIAIAPFSRLHKAWVAHTKGIKTWVSFEPVLNADYVCKTAREFAWLFDKVKVGKLNYHPSDIDWAEFGHRIEAILQETGQDYTIKESLLAEMKKRSV